MKHLPIAVLVSVGLATSAQAAMVLTLDDLSTPGIDVIIVDNADGGVGTPTTIGLTNHPDGNALEGVIHFSGIVGLSFTVNVTTGLSAPVIGTSSEAKIDLDSTNLSSFSGGTLKIMLTDTDFCLPGATADLLQEIGGRTDGTVQWESILDVGNQEFGVGGGQLFRTSGSAGSPLAFTDTSSDQNIPLTGPFSLTSTVWITHTGGSSTTFFGYETSATATDPEAPAETLMVLNNADAGPGSLRQAIADANCGDVINFAPDLSGQTVTLTSGHLIVDKDLVIDGSTLTNGITLDGNGNSRIVLMPSRDTEYKVMVDSVTFTGGSVGGGAGGAVASQVGTSLCVRRCTFYGNHADAGSGDAGAIMSRGMLEIENSTFTQNSAIDRGGAIRVEGPAATIRHVTIVGNAAPYGGGIAYGETSAIELENIVLADNDPNNLWTPGDGTNLQRLGGNYIGSGALLAPMGNYRGPTPTMPPLAGSPAVDAGGAVPMFASDQRGFPRPVGFAPDLGAVEGVYNPDGPGCIDTEWLGDGSWQFRFTNVTSAIFPVFASSDLLSWSRIGFASEKPPGSNQFYFIDPEAIEILRRFYSVGFP